MNDPRCSFTVYSSLLNIVTVLPFVHGYNARRISYIDQLTLSPWPATHRQLLRLPHTLIFRAIWLHTDQLHNSERPGKGTTVMYTMMYESRCPQVAVLKYEPSNIENQLPIRLNFSAKTSYNQVSSKGTFISVPGHQRVLYCHQQIYSACQALSPPPPPLFTPILSSLPISLLFVSSWLFASPGIPRCLSRDLLAQFPFWATLCPHHLSEGFLVRKIS